MSEIWIIGDMHLGHRNIILHAMRRAWMSTNLAFDLSKPIHFKFNFPWKVTDEDLERHDTEMIDRINSMVSKHDILIILGDFAFSNHEKYLMRIKGKKTLVESMSSDGVYPVDVKQEDGVYSVFVEGNHDDMNSNAKRHFKEICQISRKMLPLEQKYIDEFVEQHEKWKTMLSKGVLPVDRSRIEGMSRHYGQYKHPQHNRQDVSFSHYAMGTWASSPHGSWNIFAHSHGRYPEWSGKLQFDGGVDVWDYGPLNWTWGQERMMRKLRELWASNECFVDGETIADDFKRMTLRERVFLARQRNMAVLQDAGVAIKHSNMLEIDQIPGSD